MSLLLCFLCLTVFSFMGWFQSLTFSLFSMFLISSFVEDMPTQTPAQKYQLRGQKTRPVCDSTVTRKRHVLTVSGTSGTGKHVSCIFSSSPCQSCQIFPGFLRRGLSSNHLPLLRFAYHGGESGRGLQANQRKDPQRAIPILWRLGG